MKKHWKVLTLVCILVTVQFSNAVTKKTFDFVVGVNGNFKDALSDAGKKASSSNRYHIFFPKGEYNIGSLTGDGNQMTTITTSNISIIGESNTNTTIYNKPTQENISTTATLYFNNANNIYMQDITILNKGDYGSASAGTATGRYVTIEDRSDKNIYKNVKLLSNQDTYYSLSKRTYWEDSEIHGYVDFICGGGDVFFNRCLLYLEKRSTVVIAAPSTSTTWGYVFSNCTIDGYSDGYRLGRSWSNTPKCVYINTIMKKIPIAAGWGDPMNVVPTVFAEYNSKTASGSVVDLKDRRTTYTKDVTTVKLNPVLTSAQAATYTIKNVLSGNDNWQPESYTKQLNAPVARQDGATISWDDNDDALCWAVFKDDKFLKCVTQNKCEITSAASKYQIRAVNAMGGLSAGSNVVSVTTTANKTYPCSEKSFSSFNPVQMCFIVNTSLSRKLTISIFTTNGRMVYLKEFNLQSGSGSVRLPLKTLHTGSYCIKTDIDGLVKTENVIVN